jgi:shikimate dehydrogenase
MSEKNNHRFGLLGRDIDYSFSKTYFTEKFEREERLTFSYENFDLPNLKGFKTLLAQSDLKGMNVTIPYKEEVIPFLDALDEVAKAIGAVNTIVFNTNGTTKGYNTDYIGFRNSITPVLRDDITSALILGTGGASKAVVFALQKMGIKTQYVSRKKTANSITYDDITSLILKTHKLIVNCTPLGTFPNIDLKPALNYNLLTSEHVLFDLIYNPSETSFLKEGLLQGATIANGASMLVGQAEASWSLWNS